MLSYNNRSKYKFCHAIYRYLLQSPEASESIARLSSDSDSDGEQSKDADDDDEVKEEVRSYVF